MNVDARSQRALDDSQDADRRLQLESLQGTVAIANARLAYEQLRTPLLSDRWKSLAAEDPRDLAIPDRGFGLRTLSLAQSLGDFAVLEQRERRALREHLTGDVAEGLVELREVIEHALG